LTIDLESGKANASEGHKVDAFANGELTVTSTRYPFCATGATNSDNSIRSGMALVPFQQDLNRLTLIVKGGPARAYQVTWGDETRTYSSAELAAGVNLADDFVVNPFSASFNRVDEAVMAKQAYETTQIKRVFHGQEGKADMVKAVERTEAERAPLVAAIVEAMTPVQHTIRLVAVE
jgi:hypothetical protein